MQNVLALKFSSTNLREAATALMYYSPTIHTSRAMSKQLNPINDCVPDYPFVIPRPDNLLVWVTPNSQHLTDRYNTHFPGEVKHRAGHVLYAPTNRPQGIVELVIRYLNTFGDWVIFYAAHIPRL